ncbi:hypothetical protein V6N13_001217 [Hibiscus sabdariffa]
MPSSPGSCFGQRVEEVHGNLPEMAVIEAVVCPIMSMGSTHAMVPLIMIVGKKVMNSSTEEKEARFCT